MPATLTTAPIAQRAPSDTISSNMITSLTPIISNARSDQPRPPQKLSNTLSPLIFGTATLNYQFNVDPYALHPNTLVSSALASGIRAFDTSPYYGPAEEILGAALHSPEVVTHPSLKSLKRSDYHILTKAGRIRGDEFDYSPSWIRHSVRRSLRRLKTTYLDVVYLHDVEFVSPGEVLSAVTTLREIRDTTGTIRFVGICGYPVHVLTSLSEMILRVTGEPLDIVQSYANFTVQNQRLRDEGLARLIGAGVDVVANASPLGMGLLRSQGVPIGAMGNWHPAPDELRTACLKAAAYVSEQYGEKLETVAVRFAMENWIETGSFVGSKGPVPSETIHLPINTDHNTTTSRPKLGVNVMGVSRLSELADTMNVYNAIITASQHPSTATSPFPTQPHLPTQPNQTHQISTEITQILGPWMNHAWSSPDPGFVNQRTQFGVSDAEREEFERMYVGDGNADADADAEKEKEKEKQKQKDIAEKAILQEAARQLNELEKSVSAVDTDEKINAIGVEVEETVREMTPPR